MRPPSSSNARLQTGVHSWYAGVCTQLYHIISVYFTVYSIMQNYSCGRFLAQGALMHCIDARFMEWTPAPASAHHWANSPAVGRLMNQCKLQSTHDTSTPPISSPGPHHKPTQLQKLHLFQHMKLRNHKCSYHEVAQPTICSLSGQGYACMGYVILPRGFP